MILLLLYFCSKFNYLLLLSLRIKKKRNFLHAIAKLNCSWQIRYQFRNYKFSKIGFWKLDYFYSTDYERCGYLFAKAEFDDVWIGVCLLIIALVMLVGCLGLLVKILNALMKAKLVDFIKNTLNKDLPHVPWLTGYVALIIGAVVTFVIQSSSVFTSTLTPLVGAGIFTIERAYVLTLGSNIGKLLYYFIYFFISRSFWRMLHLIIISNGCHR